MRPCNWPTLALEMAVSFIDKNVDKRPVVSLCHNERINKI